MNWVRRICMLLSVLVACDGNSVSGQAINLKPRLPSDTGELIGLIEADSGDKPDLAYRLLMEGNTGLGSLNLRPESELASSSMLETLVRWRENSRGIKLSFVLSHWARSKAALSESCSDAEVQMLIAMMGSGRFVEATAREWSSETGNKMPYRFQFYSPLSILVRESVPSVQPLVDCLESENARLRAFAVQVLADRIRWKKNDQVSGLDQMFIKLADDQDLDVRLAVARALQYVPSERPRIVAQTLHRLVNDSHLPIALEAAGASSRWAEYASESHAVDVLKSLVRTPGKDSGRADRTLARILAAQESQSLSDAVVDAGFELLSLDTGQHRFSRSTVIRVLGYAACHCDRDRQRKVADRLCKVIVTNDAYEEMAAVRSLEYLGPSLRDDDRQKCIEALLSVISEAGKKRKVRRDQATVSLRAIAQAMSETQKQNAAKTLVSLLQEPDSRIPAFRALSSLGPAIKEHAPEIRSWMTNKHDFEIRVTAARAMWAIAPDAEACAGIYFAALESEKPSWWLKNAASKGLQEMDTKVLAYEDDLIRLLQKPDSLHPIKDVFLVLGTKAAGMSESIKRLEGTGSKNLRYYVPVILGKISPAVSSP